jgi:hypothetical protein
LPPAPGVSTVSYWKKVLVKAKKRKKVRKTGLKCPPVVIADRPPIGRRSAAPRALPPH